MPRNLLATDETKKVHHIVRWMSKIGMTAPDDSYMAVEGLDAYVSEWVNNGWKLFNTHYLGENPEGFGILYVLIKEQ